MLCLGCSYRTKNLYLLDRCLCIYYTSLQYYIQASSIMHVFTCIREVLVIYKHRHKCLLYMPLAQMLASKHQWQSIPKSLVGSAQLMVACSWLMYYHIMHKQDSCLVQASLSCAMLGTSIYKGILPLLSSSAANMLVYRQAYSLLYTTSYYMQVYTCIWQQSCLISKAIALQQASLLVACSWLNV